MVIGEYDTIAIVEVPSDEADAKLALATAALGNVWLWSARWMINRTSVVLHVRQRASGNWHS